MIAEPAARAPFSTEESGTWPSYFGGGRLRTENVLIDAAFNSFDKACRSPGMAIKRSCFSLNAGFMPWSRYFKYLVDT